VKPRVLLAGLFLLLAAAASPTAGPGQAWRDTALATFDEVWQTIDDTYPDPSFGGLDWNAVRDELRPHAESADSPDGVRRVIREMLARFGESHFALLSAGSGTRIRGEARVLVDLRLSEAGFVIVGVTPDSSASAAGLGPGQLIRQIDDEPASLWVEAAEGADARGRALDALSRAAGALTGSDGSQATLLVTDTTGDKTVVAARERERGQTVRFGNLPPLVVRVEAFERATPADRRAGVIAFNLWMPAASAQIDAAVDRFRDAAGLVIDLRGNPGGLVEMMRGVAGHVIDEAVPLGRMRTRQAELPLRVNPRRSTADGRSVDPFAGPVAILVDELTASASECFTGSLQSLGRARVFGRQTMGQALPAATRRLKNGDVLMHVLGDFVTPTGMRLEGRGVVPDEPVTLSLDELRAGRDGPLEAALAWIDREVGAAVAGGLP
jgi:carboxyl-terminal processing protease